MLNDEKIIAEIRAHIQHAAANIVGHYRTAGEPFTWLNLHMMQSEILLQLANAKVLNPYVIQELDNQFEEMRYPLTREPVPVLDEEKLTMTSEIISNIYRHIH